MRKVCMVVALAGTLTQAVVVGAVGAGQSSDSTVARRAAPRGALRETSRSCPSRGDLWYGLACAGAMVVAAHNDQWLTVESVESHSRGERHLAAAVEPIGNVAYAVPALVAACGAARIARNPRMSGAVLRIGASIGSAGVCALALKQIVGRSRPRESPNDPDDFRPFSGHESFPSGHATIAFATAAALDRETQAGWVPWIAYPAAALVGWSRVHDEEHWTSDVIAGAALGVWTASKVAQIARSGGSRFGRVGFFIGPTPGSIGLGMTAFSRTRRLGP